MEKRHQDLNALKLYTKKLDEDMTLILQSLQWDRKHTYQDTATVTCKYNPSHKMAPDKLEDHEKQCWLSSLGYTKTDVLLPDPIDSEVKSLVRLNNLGIARIVAAATKLNPFFKRGPGIPYHQPLSLERLQISFSSDERREIHDCVVRAVPACHDLTELQLLSEANKTSKPKKTPLEILAELRDMKRRRTKYRVAAKSRNYSDVLRDVIKTQMELYTGAETANNEDCDDDEAQSQPDVDYEHRHYNDTDNSRYLLRRNTRRQNNDRYKRRWRSPRHRRDYSTDRRRTRDETPVHRERRKEIKREHLEANMEHPQINSELLQVKLEPLTQHDMGETDVMDEREIKLEVPEVKLEEPRHYTEYTRAKSIDKYSSNSRRNFDDYSQSRHHHYENEESDSTSRRHLKKKKKSKEIRRERDNVKERSDDESAIDDLPSTSKKHKKKHKHSHRKKHKHHKHEHEKLDRNALYHDTPQDDKIKQKRHSRD